MEGSLQTETEENSEAILALFRDERDHSKSREMALDGTYVFAIQQRGKLVALVAVYLSESYLYYV